MGIPYNEMTLKAFANMKNIDRGNVYAWLEWLDREDVRREVPFRLRARIHNRVWRFM